MQALSYRGYRFPPAIIQDAVWLYLRCTLSFSPSFLLPVTMKPLETLARGTQSDPKCSHVI